ncbi:hypothetical protein [Agrobacterium rosae]|uniref:hypothetical protein n=1 Tax=Agrobacterium rosae TaxID=1972867 RepID=UPI003A80BDE0
MRYYDAFGEGGFHSAFMTTYAFGTLAFEDIPFPKLRGAGCRNIVVLADRAMVNQTFADFGPPSFAGSSYHLIKVSAPRAFHPKITALIGESKGRLFVGSANLTALGLAGNKEQIASIEYSNDRPENARLFRNAIAYMQRFVPKDDQWFVTSLDRAKRSAGWLYDDGTDSEDSWDGALDLNLLFDRPEITILDQIRGSVGDDRIERLIVVSPYWDDRLEGLARLSAAFGDPPTDILIDPENGFPGSALPRLPSASLFNIGALAGGRFLHAKLIIACGTNWDHVISGSMNCTFPALMGPAAKGNAEAAIYRRVAVGTALTLLKLDAYEGEKLQVGQLSYLQQPPELLNGSDPARDGGRLTFQSGSVTWMGPVMAPFPADALRIYDRDGLRLAETRLEGKAVATLSLLEGQPRPKYGRVAFSDGSVSAPVVVTDLNVLAVSTLPRRMGKKKQLVDSLSEAMNEDLDLIEMLNRLEDVEAEEIAARPESAPKTNRQKEAEAVRSFGILTYEEFVRARTNAIRDTPAFGLYQSSRSDKGVHVLSVCLNKMIGLVGADLASLEEIEIESQNAIDLRTTEPSSEDVATTTSRGQVTSAASRLLARRNLSTAKKFQEAVDAFSVRCAALRAKQITTSEIVRIRALMQIILSYAQPISGTSLESQILPVYNVSGHDWPRLIGRLLMLHFGTARALQYLTVEPDEAEQQRVIEYLALANWAATAALQAAGSHKNIAILQAPLTRLANDLTLQTKAVLTALTDDQAYYNEMMINLNDRFAARLGIRKHALQSSFLAR